MKNNKTVVICSSVSFYEKVVEVEKELKNLGFKVVIPLTATKMKKTRDFKVETYKTWETNPENYKTDFVSYPHRRADGVLVTKYRGCFFGISMSTRHTKHIACPQPRGEPTGLRTSHSNKRKAFLTKAHFEKVEKGDVVLILNYKKNGKNGYIGGAVLMEMAVAFYFKKPIYILNPIDESSKYKEELYGVLPKIIDGDLSKIK